MDTSIVVKKNRLIPHFGGKTHELPTEPLPSMPQAELLDVEKAVDALWRWLDFGAFEETVQESYVVEWLFSAETKVRTHVTQRTIPELFARFSTKLNALKTCYEQMAAFCRAIIECNLEFRGFQPEDRMVDSMVTKFLEQTNAAIVFHEPEVHGAKLAIAAPKDVHSTMEKTLRNVTDRLLWQLSVTLDRLLELEHIGWVNWVSDKVCTFQFYRWVAIDEALDSRTSNQTLRDRIVTTVEKDFQRTLRHAMHYHEVIESSRKPLPAPEVLKPERVQKLLSHVPPWLAPAVSVLDGQEIFRRILERDLHQETRTVVERREQLFDRDPAILLGNFVLTGWENGHA